ncbi:MAG: B12-binding domain-containing radical SAM protein [Elusimicrobia bacterium]|nr:B12-binding domain-containing radical SAM protein [Elusimicrobiota bacterium]
MSEALADFLRPFASPELERRLVLIHSPTFNFEGFQPEVLKNRGYYAYPPRGLQCLATAVKDVGVKADLLDLNFLLLERLTAMDLRAPVDLYALLLEILDEYLAKNPDVGIFGVSTGVIVPNLFLSERHPFLEILRRLMERGKGLVLAGGPCATIEARNLVRGRWAHVVFKGEAEDRLRHLLRLVFEGASSPAIAGIAFLKDGQYAESAGSEEMVDFQESLIATYDQLPVERYHAVGCLSPFSRMAGTEKPYASLQLIRGCRMKCTFCGLTQYRGSNKVCRYPADRLFEELEFLAKRRGIRHFEWVDEDLLADRALIVEMLERIAAADFKVTWAADIGLIAAYLDDPLLELMARSGCVGFRIGVESGNDEMLRKIKKPATKPKLRELSRRLARYPQFFVVGLFMLGFEGETYGQMFDTLSFAIELDIAWSHFCVYQEMKETEAAVVDRLDKRPRGGVYKDWLPSTQKVVGSSSIGAAAESRGPREIFSLPPGEVHSEEVKQEFWFAFNLIANYLCNKNLRPGGNIDALIRWLAGLQMTYPRHPVMSLFLSLAYRVSGDLERMQAQVERTRRNLRDSEYWRGRFAQYGLDRILAEYPASPEAVPELLADIVSSYRLPFPVRRGARAPADAPKA